MKYLIILILIGFVIIPQAFAAPERFPENDWENASIVFSGIVLDYEDKGDSRFYEFQVLDVEKSPGHIAGVIIVKSVTPEAYEPHDEDPVWGKKHVARLYFYEPETERDIWNASYVSEMITRHCNNSEHVVVKMIRIDNPLVCVTPDTAQRLAERNILVDRFEFAEPLLELPEPWPNVAPGLPLETNYTDIVNANNQFAIDYYKQVNKNENIFFSPWSITSVFAIVNEGARGNTADEIQNVFGFEHDSKKQFKAINNVLNQENPGYIIEVANSLWLAQNFVLNSDYVDTVETYYDGVIEKVDFADDGTGVINDWVSEKTRQKIPKLFSPPLDSKTRLVVANAIYFNGTWSMPFDEKNTRDDKFIISPGKDITIPFMNKDSIYKHTATEQFQMIELPYEGNGASMLILLPERIDGIESLEAQLTPENLVKWRSDMTKSRLFLQIPKFTLETEYNLVKDLMSLGIIDAFGSADFSGISSESLFIDRAVHKAFVDVNEKGTEAAAATGGAMATSMPPTFRADHPFVFVILENETGNILFLGKVVDPSE